MDNNTTDDAVITVQYETPTVGEVATQALIAAGVTLAVTALAYGALYATATTIGFARNKVAAHKARKEAKNAPAAEEAAE